MSRSSLTSALTLRRAREYAARANASKGEVVRERLRELAQAVMQQWKANIASFTPGEVRDLSPNYKKRKQELVGFAYPILVRTGALIASMYAGVRRDGRRWRCWVGFTGQHPENGVPMHKLAGWHRRGDGHLPARDYTKLPAGFFTSHRRKLSRLITRR